MDPPATDLEKIEDQKEGGPSFHCDLYDTEVVHKIAQVFLPGLATACVDNTTGDIFRSPGSVAADIRKEMIDYLTRRSESFVAEHIVLEGGLEIEASHDPYDTISDDLKPRVEQIQQLSSRLSEARNARALTNLVKEIDAKLGPLEIKPKNSTGSESDKPENTEKKALEEAEIKEITETVASPVQTAREAPGDEVVSKEAEVLVDGTKVEEAAKKVSEAEIAENVNEEGELKAQKLLEIGEFIKEGDNNSASDLSERTETKAPEVVVMDEESAETKQSRTDETRGLEIEVNDVIDEEDKERKKPTETETEAPSRIVMDKEEDEEGTETVKLKARASDEAEALSKSSEGFSTAQAETVPNMS